MQSPWNSGLRSVALTVPDLAAAEAFYTGTWGLTVAALAPASAQAPAGGVLYRRGSGADHHLLALHAAPSTPRIVQVTLRARRFEAPLAAIAEATVAAGGVVAQPVGPATGPASGQSLVVRDADGRRIEVVHGDAQRPPDAPPPPGQPLRLAHAVLLCRPLRHRHRVHRRG